MSLGALAVRQDLRLHADPSRVVADLFVPGHAFPGGGGRATEVVAQLRALADGDVASALEDVHARFGDRHRDLLGVLRSNADRIRNRLEPGEHLSEERWLLLGATFTHELALEGAALCNPSLVALAPPADPSSPVEVVMSVRQIGEGHRSTLGFRAGTVDHDGVVAIEVGAPFATAGATSEAPLRADLFRGGGEASAWVLERLGSTFTTADLESRLVELGAQRDTRSDAARTVALMRSIAGRCYRTTFGSDTELDERVLQPSVAVESNGVEDARFVRMAEGEGPARYCATYTGFDGMAIVQQLLATDDFTTFTSTPLLGAAATNKGLALFPRTIDGDFVALTRFDGANNAIARSRDINSWPDATHIRHPRGVWEIVQVGNCGAPIETVHGWLVLTHGVGPMRTYAIGAWLLDLDDPTRLLGQLPVPLLAPTKDEQDGYVPNVVYSCGAMAHGDRLVIPYGIGDAAIGFASASITEVIAAMVR